MSLPEKRVELEELLDDRRDVEKELADANRQYKIGLWAVLLGIPFLFAYGIGLLFIVAGALAAATNHTKRGNRESELEVINERIAELRREIARLESDKE